MRRKQPLSVMALFPILGALIACAIVAALPDQRTDKVVIKDIRGAAKFQAREGLKP
jgi:type IV secretory pathway component VirB8